MLDWLLVFKYEFAFKLQIWIYVPGHLQLHEIIYLWSSCRETRVYFASSLSLLKKLILNDREKDCTRLALCSITWQIWREKGQCNRFCFSSVGVRAIRRIVVGIKSFGQYKKLAWDKFVKEKRKFAKYFLKSETINTARDDSN